MFSGNQPKMYGFEDNLINEIEVLKVEIRRDKLLEVQRQENVDKELVSIHKSHRNTRRLSILNLFLIAMLFVALAAYWITANKIDSSSKAAQVPVPAPVPAPVPVYEASRIGAIDMRVREIAMDIELQAKLSVGMKMRLQNMQMEVESQAKRLDAIKERVQLLEKNATVHEKKLNVVDERMRELAGNIEQQNYGVFLWRIDQWASRRDAAVHGKGILSDAFFSDKNGYKMRLSLRPADQPKGQSICVYWQLVRGPFDSIIAWPFRYSVTLSLVNQRTRTNHASRTLKFDARGSVLAWSRPVGESNSAICFHLPVSYDELSHNQDLCGNDQVFIRCVLVLSSRSRSSRLIAQLGLSGFLVMASLARCFF